MLYGRGLLWSIRKNNQETVLHFAVFVLYYIYIGEIGVWI